MATIALRFPTVNTSGTVLQGGHRYIVFPEPTITARELLKEGVLAEFRKARAGGIHSSVLPILFGRSFNAFGPLDEQFACERILNLFSRGDVALLVDSKIVTDLDQVLELHRRTGLALVIMHPTLEVA